MGVWGNYLANGVILGVLGLLIFIVYMVVRIRAGESNELTTFIGVVAAILITIGGCMILQVLSIG